MEIAGGANAPDIDCVLCDRRSQKLEIELANLHRRRSLGTSTAMEGGAGRD